MVVLSSCTSFAQSNDELSWDDFEIIGYKKVATEYLEIKDSADWPILNDFIYSLNNKKIIIEGYYYCMESINLETLTTEEVCILAIAKEPTTQICGIPQFRQNEFIRVIGNPLYIQGEKIKITGKLHINKNGSSDNLISLDDATIKK